MGAAQLRGTLRIVGTGTVPDVGRCAVHQTGCIMPGQGQSGASGRRKNTKKSGRAGIPGGVPAFSVRKRLNEDLQELMAKGGEKTCRCSREKYGGNYQIILFIVAGIGMMALLGGLMFYQINIA